MISANDSQENSSFKKDFEIHPELIEKKVKVSCISQFKDPQI